jgi:hypothetical protein
VPNLTMLTASPTTRAELLDDSEKWILNFAESIVLA